MIKSRGVSDNIKKKLMDYPVDGKRTVDDILIDICIITKLKIVDVRQAFHVVVNGKILTAEEYNYILKPTDDVMICPRLLNNAGEQRALVSTVLTIATIAALGPSGLGILPSGGVGLAASTIAIQLGAAYAANSLVPLPNPTSADINQDSNIAESQIYTISGQSNTVKRLGIVPKVYGTHRMFPNIAANPYIELEVYNGELAQYLYCIYDFGYGPNLVSSIQIGDTPLENFAADNGVQYRFVDPNRPTTSEGAWDDNLYNSFQIYKGDVTTENLSVILNKNQNDVGAVQSEFLAIRNTDNDTASREIALTFVAPRGLYSFSAEGTKGFGAVDLLVEFRKVGTPTWYSFSDFNVVQDCTILGGDESFDRSRSDIALFNLSEFTSKYELIFNEAYTYKVFNFTTGQYSYYQGTKRYYGIRFNTDLGIFPTLFFENNANAPVAGRDLWVNGERFGRVVSTSIISGKVAATVTEIASGIRSVIVGYTVAYQKDGQSFVQTVDGPFNYTEAFYKSTPSAGKLRIKNDRTDPVYAQIKFKPIETGEFEIRVTRQQTIYQYTNNQVSDISWTQISSRLDRVPIVTDKRHTFLELKIRATNQLNGVVQNLNAIVTSVLPQYNGTSWVKGPTDNPAWIFADLLTGQTNKNPIPYSRLDTASLLEWANFSSQIPTAPPSYGVFIRPRFSCNFILDYQTTLQQVVSQVTSAGQASLNLLDGKYGVLIDKRRTTPVQLFTPRNSRNFSSSRNYNKKPHAIAIKYVDPSVEWELREAIVYDTGYDVNNAEDIEEITSFGVTNPEQAWRFGRYVLAQHRLRQETITIEVDFENLVCTRGDFVQIVQDAMKVGGTAARVIDVSGNTVTIDEGIETLVGPSYGYVFRSITGQIIEDTLTVISADTFELDGTLPQVGDLIVIGVVDQIVFDCIVKTITPGPDLTATLTLVERADAIYDAESTDTIPEYTPQISITANTEFAPPGPVIDFVIVDTTYECFGAGFRYYIDLDWEVPTGSAYDIFEVYLDIGLGFDLIDTTKKSLYRYYVDNADLGTEHKFKVLAVSATGNKINLGEASQVSSTPTVKTDRPPNVEILWTDITNQVLQLSWPTVNDCGVQEYLIRYSPNSTSYWETSTPLIRASRNATSVSVQARTGIYLIKAIDYAGNESQDATAAITTIPELQDLNVIEETTDFPTLPGTKDRTESDGSSLLLRQEVPGDYLTGQYFTEGYYYFENLLNLGDIYTVRLQSQIIAEGFTLSDLMSSWTTLSDVTALSRSAFSDWDVQAQYRTTDISNFMADWDPLSDVVTMSGGDEDNWTEWRNFSMGDATGKIFAFRLRLISNKRNVTPRVTDAVIRADMPDRTLEINNLSVSALGTPVTYDKGFYGPGSSPNIQVSIQNAQSGDYPSYASKTLDGFTLTILNSSNTPVARIVDIAVKGYGKKADNIL